VSLPRRSQRAGQLAQPQDLVDVPWLVSAYYTLKPDPEDVDQQVAFGTSGTAASLNGSFNEDHIAATTQAICDYRKEQGIDGPLFLGATPTACPSRPGSTALEVLIANDVTTMIDVATVTRRPRRSRTRSCAQPRAAPATAPVSPTGSSSPPRTTRPPTVASNTTRPTAGRPTPTRPR
jgi:hypothetical protein